MAVYQTEIVLKYLLHIYLVEVGEDDFIVIKVSKKKYIPFPYFENKGFIIVIFLKKVF